MGKLRQSIEDFPENVSRLLFGYNVTIPCKVSGSSDPANHMVQRRVRYEIIEKYSFTIVPLPDVF